METKKSQKADLQGKRFLFFEIGLIAAIGLMIYLFSLAVTNTLDKKTLGNTGFKIDDEMMPITIQKPEPPKPEPVKKYVAVIDIVDNGSETPIDPDIFIEAPTDEPVVYVPIEPEQTIPEPEIFVRCEKMPEFPGGDKALLKFIAKQVEYPEMAKQNGIGGKVFVSFVVNKYGEVEQVKIARSVDPVLDKEAMRVIAMLPKWKPGMQREKPVNVQFTVPINFQLN